MTRASLWWSSRTSWTSSKRREFDTVYFEHLSYFGLTPFIHALQNTGLVVFDAEKFQIHGGTLRLYVCRAGAYGVTTRVLGMRIEEELIRTDAIYEDFNREVKRTIDTVGSTLRGYRKAGKTVAGFGASAKGNTLLNACGITKELDYIVDETPEKIGKYSPARGSKLCHRNFYDEPARRHYPAGVELPRRDGSKAAPVGFRG